jgi:methyl-accepting chemotaxis protein
MALPALKSEPYRHEIILALERANALTAGARAATAAYLMHRGGDAKTQIKTALDTAYKAIKEASANVGDDGVSNRIEALHKFVPRYQGAFDNALAAIAGQETVLRERADPARADLHRILDDTAKALSQRTAEREAALADHEIRSQTISRLGELAVALVLIVSALFARFSVAHPIRRIGDVLLQLANGNKSVEIPYAHRTDEIGETARAATAFKDNIAHMERLEAEQKQTEAQARAARRTEMHKLADGFEAAIGMIVNGVSSASNQLETAAATLTRTAGTTQELVGIVAGASGEASSNVQTVAAAADELAASINEISRQVQESTRIASEAVKQAQSTDVRIGALSQAASRIGDVVKLITAIAEQTNLLALNATIEAARAGDAGRGFAVVAQEVKSLAAQTAKATGDIGAQITGMQAATQESVAAIKEIGATIARVAEIATAIKAAVEEQGVSTAEIARNVRQAAQGTSQVASNIADVRAGAGETGTASTQVLSSARALSTEGNRLKAEVDRFISTVRAA